MICPVCEHEQDGPGDWCVACGAYLALIRHRPRRVMWCVVASICLGSGLFGALAWQVFSPVFRGWPPADPGPLFWWGFVLGTFFLSLGLTARQHLMAFLQRILHPLGRRAHLES